LQELVDIDSFAPKKGKKEGGAALGWGTLANRREKRKKRFILYWNNRLLG